MWSNYFTIALITRWRNEIQRIHNFPNRFVVSTLPLLTNAWNLIHPSGDDGEWIIG